MSTYFKPWWRKIGVFTLVMACLFASGWVRSQTIGKGIHFNNSNNSWTYFLVATSFGKITIIVNRWPGEMVYPNFISDRLDDPELTEDREIEENNVKWYWRFCGFGRGIEDGSLNSKWTRTEIPFWSIVIPLTSLSAWLLLSKPRTKKPSV